MSPPSPIQTTVTAAPTHEQIRWFAEEVQPHGSSLGAYLRRQFPWLLEADDIVQEALLRLWRRSRNEQFPGLKSPKAALFAIARNAALDVGRRRAVAEIGGGADMERFPSPDDVAETVSTRQELEFLAAAMRDLPERCRQVLTLVKMYGYAQKEVAERLGISEFTVRAQVAKGMRRCAEYMRRHGVSRNPDECR